jgi:hypothetical protein
MAGRARISASMRLAASRYDASASTLSIAARMRGASLGPIMHGPEEPGSGCTDRPAPAAVTLLALAGWSANSGMTTSSTRARRPVTASSDARQAAAPTGSLPVTLPKVR